MSVACSHNFLSKFFLHLLPLPIRRVRVLLIYLAVPLSLVHLVHSARVTARWNLTTGWRVPDRRQLRPAWPRWVVLSSWRLVGVSRWFAASICSARSFFVNLALVVFFLFTLLPLLSNFLEFYNSRVLVGAKLMLVKRGNRNAVGSIRLHAT